MGMYRDRAEDVRTAQSYADALADATLHALGHDLRFRERQLVAAVRAGARVLRFTNFGDSSMDECRLPTSYLKRWWMLRQAGYRMKVRSERLAK